MSAKKHPIIIGGEKHWLCNMCNSIKPDNLFLKRKNQAPSYCSPCWISYKRKYEGRPIQKVVLGTEAQEAFYKQTIEELGL